MSLINFGYQNNCTNVINGIYSVPTLSNNLDTPTSCVPINIPTEPFGALNSHLTLNFKMGDPNINSQDLSEYHYYEQLRKGDEDFVRKFVEAKEDSTHESSLLLSDVKTNLKSVIKLVRRAEAYQTALEQIARDDSEHLVNKMDETLMNLDLFKEGLFDPKFSAGLKRKVEKLESKRIYRKRKKQKREEDSYRLQSLWKTKHQEIDDALEKVHQKDFEKREIKTVVSEADLALHEINHKILDIEKYRILVMNIVKLHSLKSGSHNVSQAQTSDSESFSSVCKTLLQHLDCKYSKYIDDKLQMKSLMHLGEGDDLGTILFERKVDAFVSHYLTALFGTPPPRDSPIYPVYHLYTNASRSLHQLVEIRQQWDVFLNPKGSSVPLGWIIPQYPHDGDWKQFLTENN